ncbi:MAG: glutaredoxin family protein [Thermodesulfobacteriota bacterium]
MNEKKVVVYTQTGCSACEAAKEFLSQEGINFEEKNIMNDELAMKQLSEKYNSRSTPTILVDDEVIIGFDREELERVLA